MSHEKLKVELRDDNQVVITRDTVQMLLDPTEISLIVEIANQENKRKLEQLMQKPKHPKSERYQHSACVYKSSGI